MLKPDPEAKRKTKKIQADKFPKSFIFNRVKEKTWKMIKKDRK